MLSFWRFHNIVTVQMAIVRVENVSKHYRLGDQDVRALTDVSLAIEPGVFLAIAGMSMGTLWIWSRPERLPMASE